MFFGAVQKVRAKASVVGGGSTFGGVRSSVSVSLARVTVEVYLFLAKMFF